MLQSLEQTSSTSVVCGSPQCPTIKLIFITRQLHQHYRRTAASWCSSEAAADSISLRTQGGRARCARKRGAIKPIASAAMPDYSQLAVRADPESSSSPVWPRTARVPGF